MILRDRDIAIVKLLLYLFVSGPLNIIGYSIAVARLRVGKRSRWDMKSVWGKKKKKMQGRVRYTSR